MTENLAYKFCLKSIDLPTTPKYVKLQMKDFIDLCEGKNKQFELNLKKLKQIENILKILIMPKGLKAGKTLFECTTGYQWLFYTAILCTVYRNNHEKRRYETGLLEISRKNFKALALDTPIPTPNGWKKMGDITVGDLVFGVDGKPTMVIGESEIFNKPMYSVEFSDGEKIKASGDHIWTVKTKSASNNCSLREITTEEISKDYFRVRNDGKGKEYKYKIPNNGAVEYEKKELLLDPYLLGVWLGDGTSTTTDITGGREDLEEISKYITENTGYVCELHTPKNRSCYIKVDKRKNNSENIDSFIYKLKKLNLISNKHIPNEYLTASVDQRTELLKGLMDSDGTCSLKGQCSFLQKSKILAEQFLELLNSLGIKATIIKRKSFLNQKEVGKHYFISFFVSKDKSCFKLKRKKSRLKDVLNKNGTKSIVKIEKIPAEPSKCIMVSSPSHLYLAGKHFTPTHNTYTIATIFIILFLTEPRFSKFYSVAPDGALSREVKEAISETIKSSPMVYEYNSEPRFKILRDCITFKPFQTQYIPLSYSTSRMDGRMPAVFIADEVGALPSNYAIEAMKSGQLNILNKLGFIISTKYPSIDNPFEDEVGYSKKVLEKTIEDDTRFSLLYEPDKTEGWETDDLILKQANPVAVESEEIFKDLVKKRTYAIAVDSARENFVTKHCNIVYQGTGTETFIDTNIVRECKVSDIDWKGRLVYVGFDLSECCDNTSVSMVSIDDDENILAESFAFIPEGRIEEKTVSERVNYLELSKSNDKLIVCGDRVIDYCVVEDFIVSLEEKYGVKIQAIGYDRWNALSTAQKLEKAGYNLVEIKQHSSTLHPPTKLLKEKILKGEFKYTENKLLEINFQNARCTYDTNKNLYVTKKKSTGKIDMVISLINAIFLLEKDVILNQMDFLAQTI